MRQSAPIQNRGELDNQPIYNIKAVVEATGLPAATLRAWERRYGALAPGRTEHGYRLYSANDIATLQWLKQRIDEGMSISQALALLGRSHQSAQTRPAADRQPDTWQGLGGEREALLGALLTFEEGRAERVLEEAFAIYGLEPVIEHLIAPAMAQVGDMWHRGQASTAAEHFASSFLRRKLDAIINAAPRPAAGGLIVLGCAPNDWHELGLQLIHLMLRRRGLNSLYLGQNVPAEQFIEEMARLRPAMVIIAAALAETAPGVAALGQAVAQMAPPRPLFAYGGRIFNAEPGLRANVPGIFLGESARAAADYVSALMADATAAEGAPAPKIRVR
jgi:methanogenic corrinoid protein MtbC1